MTHSAPTPSPPPKSCGGWPTSTEDPLVPALEGTVPDHCVLLHRLMVVWQGADRGVGLAEGHTHKDREEAAAAVAREIAALERRLAQNWLAGFRAAFVVDREAVGGLVLMALRDRLEYDREGVVSLLADAMQGEFAEMIDLIHRTGVSP